MQEYIHLYRHEYCLSMGLPIYHYHLLLIGVISVGVSGHLNQPVEDECCRIDGQMARGRTVVMDTEFYTKDTG